MVLLGCFAFTLRISFDSCFVCLFPPTENGELYTFGESEGGKLGLGDDTDESNVPQHVMSITDRVKAVSCGGSHTVALTGNEIHPNTSCPLQTE